MSGDQNKEIDGALQFARAAVWMTILGGTVVFWGSVGWWLLQFVR